MNSPRLSSTGIRSVVLVAVAVIAVGCMTVSDSRPVVASSNAGQLFVNKRIAMLPVKTQSSLAPDSVVGIRNEITKLLGPALKTKMPKSVITDIGPVTDQLNQRNILSAFEQLLMTYENTGVFDRQRITAIARALGADYLLVSRLKVEKMDLLISKGQGGSLDLSMVDANTGEITWAGSGEWKRGGVFGFGGASASEVGFGLVDKALEGLR